MYSIYNGLIFMLVIQIPIRLDLDLFGQIRILQRAMVVRGRIIQPRSQTGIRVIANPLDLSTMILDLPMPNSTCRSFEKADFQSERWIREPKFRPITLRCYLNNHLVTLSL
jgi:hypothetical protein